MNRHQISLGKHIVLDACPKDRKASDIGCWYLIIDAVWGGDYVVVRRPKQTKHNERMVQMFSFTDDERAYLTEMRKITTDARGNEVLVGLTLEETDFYINHARQRIAGEDNHRNAGKYLELHEKHERARFEVLGAEIYLRDEGPSLH